jgi:hypothetical protein
MDDWIIRLNIAHFEHQLSRCSDPEQKRVLGRLLDEERAKLGAQCAADPSEASASPDQASMRG